MDNKSIHNVCVLCKISVAHVIWHVKNEERNEWIFGSLKCHRKY